MQNTNTYSVVGVFVISWFCCSDYGRPFGIDTPTSTNQHIVVGAEHQQQHVVFGFWYCWKLLCFLDYGRLSNNARLDMA